MAPADRILVINPNSTEAVTQGIDAAMEPLRIAGGPAIECVTLKEGPPGIQTQADVESVVAPIGNMVRSRDNDCSAFVIACYSDPGLHAAREVTTKPVLGIAECGILTAMTLGQRFGVISILKKSIPRHLRYVGQMAWPGTVTAFSAMSGFRWSSQARPPSRWRSAGHGWAGRSPFLPHSHREEHPYSAAAFTTGAAGKSSRSSVRQYLSANMRPIGWYFSM